MITPTTNSIQSLLTPLSQLSLTPPLLSMIEQRDKTEITRLLSQHTEKISKEIVQGLSAFEFLCIDFGKDFALSILDTQIIEEEGFDLVSILLKKGNYDEAITHILQKAQESRCSWFNSPILRSQIFLRAIQAKNEPIALKAICNIRPADIHSRLSFSPLIEATKAHFEHCVWQLIEQGFSLSDKESNSNTSAWEYIEREFSLQFLQKIVASAEFTSFPENALYIFKSIGQANNEHTNDWDKLLSKLGMQVVSRLLDKLPAFEMCNYNDIIYFLNHNPTLALSLFNRAEKSNLKWLNSKEITTIVFTHAIVTKNTSIIDRLLSKIDVHYVAKNKEASQRTPLMYAAETKLDSLICTLISKGARLDAVDSQGVSAFAYIIRFCSLEATRVLLTAFTTEKKQEIVANTPLTFQNIREILSYFFNNNYFDFYIPLVDRLNNEHPDWWITLPSKDWVLFLAACCKNDKMNALIHIQKLTKESIVKISNDVVVTHEKLFSLLISLGWNDCIGTLLSLGIPCLNATPSQQPQIWDSLIRHLGIETIGKIFHQLPVAFHDYTNDVTYFIRYYPSLATQFYTVIQTVKPAWCTATTISIFLATALYFKNNTLSKNLLLDIKNVNITINCDGNLQLPLLIQASAMGMDELVIALIEKGAKIDSVDTRNDLLAIEYVFLKCTPQTFNTSVVTNAFKNLINSVPLHDANHLLRILRSLCDTKKNDLINLFLARFYKENDPKKQEKFIKLIFKYFLERNAENHLQTIISLQHDLPIEQRPLWIKDKNFVVDLFTLTAHAAKKTLPVVVSKLTFMEEYALSGAASNIKFRNIAILLMRCLETELQESEKSTLLSLSIQALWDDIVTSFVICGTSLTTLSSISSIITQFGPIFTQQLLPKAPIRNKATFLDLLRFLLTDKICVTTELAEQLVDCTFKKNLTCLANDPYYLTEIFAIAAQQNKRTVATRILPYVDPYSYSIQDKTSPVLLCLENNWTAEVVTLIQNGAPLCFKNNKNTYEWELVETIFSNKRLIKFLKNKYKIEQQPKYIFSLLSSFLIRKRNDLSTIVISRAEKNGSFWQEGIRQADLTTEEIVAPIVSYLIDNNKLAEAQLLLGRLNQENPNWWQSYAYSCYLKAEAINNETIAALCSIKATQQQSEVINTALEKGWKSVVTAVINNTTLHLTANDWIRISTKFGSDFLDNAIEHFPVENRQCIDCIYSLISANADLSYCLLFTKRNTAEQQAQLKRSIQKNSVFISTLLARAKKVRAAWLSDKVKLSELFLEAAYDQQKELCIYLLPYIDANYQSPTTKMTPLHICIIQKWEDLSLELIRKGADVSILDADGVSALSKIVLRFSSTTTTQIFSSFPTAIEHFVQHTPLSSNNNIYIVLSYLMCNKNCDLAMQLASRMVRENSVLLQKNERLNQLSALALSNSMPELTLLLLPSISCFLPLEKQNHKTLVMLAAEGSFYQVVRAIIHKGSSLALSDAADCFEWQYIEKHLNKNTLIALFETDYILNQTPKAIEELFISFFEKNATEYLLVILKRIVALTETQQPDWWKNPLFKATLFSYAASKKSAFCHEIAQLCIPNIETHSRNPHCNNKSPLQLAVDAKWLDIVDTLIEQGAPLCNSNQTEQDWEYCISHIGKEATRHILDKIPIHKPQSYIFATYLLQSNVSNAELFLSIAERKNASWLREKDKTAYLFMLATHTKLSQFCFQIFSLMNANYVDTQGSNQTPLMAAAMNGLDPLVIALVENNGSLIACDTDGNSAFEYIYQYCNPKTIEVILDRFVYGKETQEYPLLITLAKQGHPLVRDLFMHILHTTPTWFTAKAASTLFFALVEKYSEFATALVDILDVHEVDPYHHNQTPLMRAIACSLPQAVITLLVERNSSLLHFDSNHISAFWMLLQNNRIHPSHLAIRQFLLDCHLNLPSLEGCTSCDSLIKNIRLVNQDPSNDLIIATLENDVEKLRRYLSHPNPLRQMPRILEAETRLGYAAKERLFEFAFTIDQNFPECRLESTNIPAKPAAINTSHYLLSIYKRHILQQEPKALQDVASLLTQKKAFQGTPAENSIYLSNFYETIENALYHILKSFEDDIASLEAAQSSPFTTLVTSKNPTACTLLQRMQKFYADCTQIPNRSGTFFIGILLQHYKVLIHDRVIQNKTPTVNKRERKKQSSPSHSPWQKNSKDTKKDVSAIKQPETQQNKSTRISPTSSYEKVIKKMETSNLTKAKMQRIIKKFGFTMEKGKEWYVKDAEDHIIFTLGVRHKSGSKAVFNEYIVRAFYKAMYEKNPKQFDNF